MEYIRLKKAEGLKPRTPELFVKRLPEDDVLAIDLETTGLSPLTNKIRLLGYSGESGCGVIDLRQLTDEEFASLIVDLSSKQIFAYNSAFDYGFLVAMCGDYVPELLGDAMVIFKLLTNDGWAGQRWDLDTAIRTALGWPVNNKDTLKEMLKRHKLPKARMSELADTEDAALFAEYCALDAEAARQLMTYCYDNATQAEADMHENEYTNLTKLVVEQQLRGIYVDRKSMYKYKLTLEAEMQDLVSNFKELDGVSDYIRENPEFNINSKHQLADLLFRHIGLDPVEYTETGRPKVDKKSLPAFGEYGKVLIDYSTQLKMLGYVNRVLDSLDEDSLIHPSLRIHGTVTGRSAGSGGLNVQQLTKNESFLSPFKARPGHVLIDTDFTSLENVVLAEHSKDPGLWELYASGKPHDSYLWVAAHIFPDSGIAEMYNMANPTKESVANAKQEFKPLRTIAKVIVLASNYGAGAPKIWQTLHQAGHDVSLDDVYQLRSMYWELFGGIKRFEQKLLRERRMRGGWIVNGLGRPLSIPDRYTKDIVNRFCQSTGVGLLHKLLMHINQMRLDRDIPMYPWLCDAHDQCTWEVKKGYEREAKDVLTEAYDRLNKEVQPTIKLKGDIDIGLSYWEFKK